MAIKEFDYYVECVFRFRNVRVVEESVKEPFPNVEFGIHAEPHHLLVSVESRAQLKAASTSNNERWRKLRQQIWRSDRGNERVFGVGVGKVAKRRPRSGLHGWS